MTQHTFNKYNWISRNLFFQETAWNLNSDIYHKYMTDVLRGRQVSGHVINGMLMRDSPIL